jgi:ArsR family transcriptional regulator
MVTVPKADLCLPVLPGPPLHPPLAASTAQEYARLCRALADETRLQIVSLLAEQAQPLCVCHIESAFGLSQSAISYHLKVLRDAGLVQTHRHGTWIYYQLCQERLQALLPLLQPPPGAAD